MEQYRIETHLHTNHTSKCGWLDAAALAEGYAQAGYGEIVAMQSLLQSSVSFMPMPGASGAQEIGFSTFLKPYFVNNDLYAAVMVWRFFTYYLVVIAGALLVVADQFLYSRRQSAERG